MISFGDNFAGAVANLEKTCQRLRQYGLQLKPSLFITSVPFLGHIIGREDLQYDPHKIQDIKTWPVPECLKSTRGFCCDITPDSSPIFADKVIPLVLSDSKGFSFCLQS